jgi:hypothetical protein
MSIVFILIAALIAAAGGHFFYQLAVDSHNALYVEDFEEKHRLGFPDARPGEYFIRSDDGNRVVFSEQRIDDDIYIRRTAVFDQDGRLLTPPPNPLAYVSGAFVVFLCIVAFGATVQNDRTPLAAPVESSHGPAKAIQRDPGHFLGNSSPISR